MRLPYCDEKKRHIGHRGDLRYAVMQPWSLPTPDLSLAFQAQFLARAHPRDRRNGAVIPCGQRRAFLIGAGLRREPHRAAGLRPRLCAVMFSKRTVELASETWGCCWNREPLVIGRSYRPIGGWGGPKSAVPTADPHFPGLSSLLSGEIQRFWHEKYPLSSPFPPLAPNPVTAFSHFFSSPFQQLRSAALS